VKSLRRLEVPFTSLAAALTVAALAILVLSDNPGQALLYLVTGPFMNRLAFGNFLESAARLTIAGVAASLAFRSGSFNLGGEGQALAGGLAAAAVALYFPDIPKFVALPLALAAGIGAGAVIGSVSGALRGKWGVDELISSFLISASLAPVGHVLLSGPMKDANSYLIAAPPLSSNYRPGTWWPPSSLGPVILWAFFAAVLAVIFLNYTRRGYEWRLRGANESFARYGGIRTGLIAVSSLSVSGALYGLAGTASLLDSGQAVQGFTGGLGWNGLAIALIAGSRPELVPLAALAYTWILLGTQSAMMHTGFPFALGGLVQATVFLLVTARRIRMIRRKI
jgi:ABC-type uncharacterized transport system permease subunit